MEDKKIQINDVSVNNIVNTLGKTERYITIGWSSNDGFGEYTMWYNPTDGKWYADSEGMDKQDNKEYLKALMNQFIEQITII